MLPPLSEPVADDESLPPREEEGIILSNAPARRATATADCTGPELEQRAEMRYHDSMEVRQQERW